jgi:hypothetical protein
MRNRDMYTMLTYIWEKVNAEAPRAQNLGRNVVLDLIFPLTCEGRNMTVDNFFASLPLAREILKRKVSLVGTVRANRVDVPRAFVAAQGRELYSSIFGFNTADQTTLVSYKVKKKQNRSTDVNHAHNQDSFGGDKEEARDCRVLQQNERRC